MTLSQTSLAAAYLASTVGAYVAITPPNPMPSEKPNASKDPKHAPIRDSIHILNITHNHINKFVTFPLGLLSLHAAALAYTYPNIPPAILRHGAQNGLNPSLVTWSASTAVPFALIFLAGVPLRLIPFRSLGKNFTFALTKPSGLKTTGIYRYVQHPSYTGVVILVLCNLMLYARMDGVMSCWVSPERHRALQGMELISLAVGGCMFFAGVWTRVTEEEKMLRGEFGEKWERWHAKTARFVPWVF
ncbi:prenyl cysteine carboxyl [Colletotrichum karsti]|uniref:Protein-S-isoprenylcysteine O-methyltransferase n=1 Tax=Colletotrichum karsti TaxID=1095194 RepID=A0A9P6I435_9PEZI|nr:prenyl cysteine carboxyl [Colletotrichum karsti]KAF9875407.1 prenyl cysteine carboxyl [Colletotrichum karsti]